MMFEQREGMGLIKAWCSKQKEVDKHLMLSRAPNKSDEGDFEFVVGDSVDQEPLVGVSQALLLG